MSDRELCIGCNYHTTWQSHPAMRFILKDILPNGDVILKTRTTNKTFTTKASDLIFIETEHNRQKWKKLRDAEAKKLLDRREMAMYMKKITTMWYVADEYQREIDEINTKLKAYGES